MKNFGALKARARKNAVAAEYLDGLTGIISNQIFKERLQQKLTQKQLGELAGVTQKTISRIEAGDQGVKIGTYEKVLSALRVSASATFYFEEETEETEETEEKLFATIY